jgi:hypothetical protein
MTSFRRFLRFRRFQLKPGSKPEEDKMVINKKLSLSLSLSLPLPLDDPSSLGRMAECYEWIQNQDDDDRRSNWLLVAAAVLGALLIGATAWWAYPAFGQFVPETWQAEPYGSTVTLRPSEEPGAVVELFFDNRGADNGGRILHIFELGGHHIEAELGLPEYPDTIRVTPADGYIAVPDVLTIPDGTTGVVLIYRHDTVGM